MATPNEVLRDLMREREDIDAELRRIQSDKQAVEFKVKENLISQRDLHCLNVNWALVNRKLRFERG